MAVPAAIPGSHSCFCSSKPCLWIAVIASDPYTLTKVRSPEAPASGSGSGSRVAMPYPTAERPGQP